MNMQIFITAPNGDEIILGQPENKNEAKKMFELDNILDKIVKYYKEK